MMRSELPPLLQNHAGLSAQVQLRQFTPEDLASYFRKSKQEFQRLELYLRAGEEKAAITLWFSIYVLLQLERNFQQGSDSSLGYYSTWPLNTTLHEQGYLRTGKNLGCIRKYSGGNIKILYSVFTLNSTQFPQKVSYNKAIYTSKFKQGLAVKSLAAKAACFDQFRLTFGLKKATNSAENQRGARAGNPASPEPSQAQGCSECSLAPHKEIAVPPFFFFPLQRGQWGLGRAEQVCYCTWSQDEDCIFSSGGGIAGINNLLQLSGLWAVPLITQLMPFSAIHLNQEKQAKQLYSAELIHQQHAATECCRFCKGSERRLFPLNAIKAPYKYIRYHKIELSIFPSPSSHQA